MACLHHFVILWRSKERSDAAQTIGSMPGTPERCHGAESAPMHSAAKVPAWIPGSPRRSCAPASP
ncbi:hypothetical protein EJ077_09335 [Mesorhizobium sp. M8A.F.Ca.ET.057.01.1.1]|nr:hypothetical protein EJ077_09335 [Mesorhizobium sp. M8A.F.Ca.ET.057.01.1.1]RWE46121.1 MAG: hypothetical protein EOS80_16125 [Mesorhizobium sp.]TJX42522.1 MAG: hypothetical protein E5W21_24150 [Mesorhizobium sp.]